MCSSCDAGFECEEVLRAANATECVAADRDQPRAVLAQRRRSSTNLLNLLCQSEAVETLLELSSFFFQALH